MIRCHRLGGVAKSKTVSSSSRSISFSTFGANNFRWGSANANAIVSDGIREFLNTSICDRDVLSLRSSSTLCYVSNPILSSSSPSSPSSSSLPRIAMNYNQQSLRSFAYFPSMSEMTKSFEEAINTAKQSLNPPKNKNKNKNKNKKRSKHDIQSTQAIYSDDKDKAKQTKKRNELVGGAAIAGGVVGLVLSGPVLGIVTGITAAGLAIANTGKVGDVARASSDVVVNLDKKHKIVDATKDVANLTVRRAKEFDDKHRVVEKARDAVDFTASKTVEGLDFISKKLEKKV